MNSERGATMVSATADDRDCDLLATAQNRHGIEIGESLANNARGYSAITPRQTITLGPHTAAIRRSTNGYLVHASVRKGRAHTWLEQDKGHLRWAGSCNLRVPDPLCRGGIGR